MNILDIPRGVLKSILKGCRLASLEVEKRGLFITKDKVMNVPYVWLDVLNKRLLFQYLTNMLR